MQGLRRVVVAGAAAAGMSAAETLRKSGYEGTLTIVDAEPHPPYRRPPLSKKLLTGALDRAKIDLRVRQQLEATVLRPASVTGLDLTTREVRIDDQGTQRALGFDGLVIATGSRPRAWTRSSVPRGVHTLRTVDDCLAIREQFDNGPRVAVVGGGFIGGEVAAGARTLGLDVVLVEQLPAPLHTALGPEMAERLVELHREHGTRLRLGVGVAGFEGDPDVRALRLDDGSRVEADLVVLGLGVAPVTDWLRGSGLRLDDGVCCDATCAAEGTTGVVAAGDVARWWHPLFGRYLRVEHWENARRQGAAAARTLLAGPGQAATYEEVPYFWSDQYKVKLQLYGTPEDYDELRIVEGDPGQWRFVAAYGQRGRTVAVLGANSMTRVHAYRDAVAAGVRFPPQPPAERGA